MSIWTYTYSCQNNPTEVCSCVIKNIIFKNFQYLVLKNPFQQLEENYHAMKKWCMSSKNIFAKFFIKLSWIFSCPKMSVTKINFGTGVTKIYYRNMRKSKKGFSNNFCQHKKYNKHAISKVAVVGHAPVRIMER